MRRGSEFARVFFPSFSFLFGERERVRGLLRFFFFSVLSRELKERCAPFFFSVFFPGENDQGMEKLLRLLCFFNSLIPPRLP